MPSIESAVVRVVVEVNDTLSSRLPGQADRKPVTINLPAAEELLHDLGTESETLQAYLESPDFAAIATQVCYAADLGGDAKEQIRQGLRLIGLTGRFRERVTNVVHQALLSAFEHVQPRYAKPHRSVNGEDLRAASGLNSHVLRRLKSLTGFHAFAARLRSQITSLHDRIRLPHIGVSRAVPYEQLYIHPRFDSLDEIRLGAPGDRVVVLGDPGAGKSTFAAKFAHDIACDESGKVPFLLVLREFTTSFDRERHDLVHYLEKVCQAPYNVKPPADAIEYLLRNGRAVVILDGLDEIVQTELRRRVVELVEGFAHLYPLVPIVVTARRIGYDDVPLDHAMFTGTRILPFSESQVQTYVERWFVLDEASSPTEQEQLAASFIQDSEQMPELRGNPLLLALLCAVYSSDRHLPRNLAQVYERCALMLFEQWDARRGIPLPLKFHGRLRGAVQHLAWQMFTAPESGRAMPRTRIIASLTRYLETKLDDHDDATATAEEFLRFCTGRSWILTDVGATDREPRFGFTHRTFLEYFSAEYLVRTHRTAAALWEALRPHIDQWAVVAQIVLQLHDRNVEGGADELLVEALNSDGCVFAARALQYTHPSSRTVRAITTTAVTRSVLLSPGDRVDDSAVDLVEVDGPLLICMYESSSANLPVVEQTFIELVENFVEDAVPGVALLLDCLLVLPHERGDDTRWQELLLQLVAHHRDALIQLRTRVPWGGGQWLTEPGFLQQMVQRFGAAALYTRCKHSHHIASNAVETLMRQAALPIPGSDVIVSTLLALPRPWNGDPVIEQAGLLSCGEHGQLDELRMMLVLPYLEVLAEAEPKQDMSPEIERIRNGWRWKDDRDIVLAWLDRIVPRADVRDFLRGWVSGAVRLTEPARTPQPPLPEPR